MLNKIFLILVLAVSVLFTGCDFPERRSGLTKEQAYTNVPGEVIQGKVIVSKTDRKPYKKSRRYYLIAQDGSKLRVSSSEYRTAIIGQPWYSSEW